jgi:putative ubiquitin-RnfH superfamily antitoxin RatB of RatAB toxin-antitoxin module
VSSCLVAVDLPEGPWLCEVHLVAGATVAEAIAAAKLLASGQPGAAQFDWDGAATGLWGKRCARSALVQPGDRLELYRPLAADPRERRRAKAGVTRGPLTRPGS